MSVEGDPLDRVQDLAPPNSLLVRSIRLACYLDLETNAEQVRFVTSIPMSIVEALGLLEACKALVVRGHFEERP